VACLPSALRTAAAARSRLLRTGERTGDADLPGDRVGLRARKLRKLLLTDASNPPRVRGDSPPGAGASGAGAPGAGDGVGAAAGAGHSTW